MIAKAQIASKFSIKRKNFQNAAPPIRIKPEVEMYTEQGMQKLAALIAEHRADPNLWPKGLKDWFSDQVRKKRLRTLTQAALLEWLELESKIDGLNTSAFRNRLSRMETAASKEPDLAIVLAFAASEFLSCPSKEGRRPLGTMDLMMIAQGKFDPGLDC